MFSSIKFIKFVRAHSLILGFALVKLLIHLFFNGNYDLHRDEFLYLTQGLFLDWGYLEVPPSVGFFARILCFLNVDSSFGVRFIPSLLGAGMVFFVGLMVKEMRGGRRAQILACIAMLVSPAMLRISWLFQPVVFNVFYWTLLGWLILRYINTERHVYLYLIGIVVGIGLLNKYSVAFYLLALIPGLAFTHWRSVWTNKHLYFSMFIALLLFLPNLFWQWQHNWPVWYHMKELQETQLVNVSLLNFLLDQLVLNLPSFFVWIVGLIWLMFSKESREYRLFAIHFFSLLLLLMVLRGKSYYTIGVYPLLMAAGGIALETWSRKSLHYFWIGVMLIFVLPILPVTLPVLKGEKMKSYFEWMVKTYRLDFPVRWEDGKVHAIPQDYADMLGWRELARKVKETWELLPEEEKKNCVIYAGNYGEAGAIIWYNKESSLPEAVSFNSSFLLWAPDQFEGHTMIYVDDTADHLKKYFDSIERVGGIENPLARERGVGIFICRNPYSEFYRFYQDLVTERKRKFHLNNYEP